jgi:hypothetical protein
VRESCLEVARAAIASSNVPTFKLTRTYRGMLPVELMEPHIKKDRNTGIETNERAPAATERARSLSSLTPLLTLILTSSERRRVLCLRIACLIGPSPAWMPPRENRRS